MRKYLPHCSVVNVHGQKHNPDEILRKARDLSELTLNSDPNAVNAMGRFLLGICCFEDTSYRDIE